MPTSDAKAGMLLVLTGLTPEQAESLKELAGVLTVTQENSVDAGLVTTVHIDQPTSWAQEKLSVLQAGVLARAPEAVLRCIAVAVHIIPPLEPSGDPRWN